MFPDRNVFRTIVRSEDFTTIILPRLIDRQRSEAVDCRDTSRMQIMRKCSLIKLQLEQVGLWEGERKCQTFLWVLSHRRSFDLSFLLSKESLIIDIFDDGETELCYDHHVESTFTLLYIIWSHPFDNPNPSKIGFILKTSLYTISCSKPFPIPPYAQKCDKIRYDDDIIQCTTIYKIQYCKIFLHKGAWGYLFDEI